MGRKLRLHWDRPALKLPEWTIDGEGTISFRLLFNSRDCYDEPILVEEVREMYSWCKKQGPFIWLGYDVHYHRIRFENIRDTIFFKLYWQ